MSNDFEKYYWVNIRKTLDFFTKSDFDKICFDTYLKSISENYSGDGRTEVSIKNDIVKFLQNQQFNNIGNSETFLVDYFLAKLAIENSGVFGKYKVVNEDVIVNLNDYEVNFKKDGRVEVNKKTENNEKHVFKHIKNSEEFGLKEIKKYNDFDNKIMSQNNNKEKEIIDNEFIEKLFEETDIDKVINGVEKIPAEKFRVNKDCVLSKLKIFKEQIEKEKTKNDIKVEDILTKFVKRKYTRNEFERKILFKVLDFATFSHNKKVDMSFADKPFPAALISCSKKEIPFLKIIIGFSILIFISVICFFYFKKKECTETKLDLRVVCLDSTFCYDNDLDLQLSYNGTTKFDINLDDGSLTTIPTYCGNDTIIIASVIGNSDFKVFNDTIYLRNNLQYVYIERVCKCEKDFKPEISIKDTKGNFYDGEIKLGITNQPTYKVICGKVDFTNNLDCRYFKTNISILSNDEKYILDTTINIHDCSLIELLVYNKDSGVVPIEYFYFEGSANVEVENIKVSIIIDGKTYSCFTNKSGNVKVYISEAFDQTKDYDILFSYSGITDKRRIDYGSQIVFPQQFINSIKK